MPVRMCGTALGNTTSLNRNQLLRLTPRFSAASTRFLLTSFTPAIELIRGEKKAFNATMK